MASQKATLAELRAEAELGLLQATLYEMEQTTRLREGCPAGWDRVEAENPTRPRKVHVTLRLDGDVAKWFWRQGEGYQARMNAVLRAYMLAKAAKVVG